VGEVVLRDHQHRLVNGVVSAHQQGHKRVLIVLVTGGGKTKTAAHMVARAIGKGRSVLWIVHRAELAEAAAADLRANGLRVGVLSASAAGDVDHDAPVQVATTLTLVKRSLRPPADVIVMDECHHLPTASALALLSSYPEAYVWGLTATPARADGRALDFFTVIVEGASARELTTAGYLAPCEIIAPDHQLHAGQIAESPAAAYLAHCPDGRAVCFSSTVAIADTHRDEFIAAGVGAATVSDSTPPDERRALFCDLRAGRIRVLCNVAICTEGTDLPELDAVILARGFGHASLYLQCVGRVLRPAPGKTKGLVLDLTGASHLHGHPAEERIYSLDGIGIRRKDAPLGQAYCRVCGACTTAGQPCEECGTAARQVPPPKVTHDPLVKWAGKRRESAEERAKTLARWIAVARAKGYRRGWVDHRFAAVYGHRPDAALWAMAEGKVAA
jgi:DNA repair protein RadD